MAKAKEKVEQSRSSYWLFVLAAIGFLALAFLMFFRLGNIMPGISPNEYSLYFLKLGYHGIYNNPLNLPMKVIWSDNFKYFTPLGQTMLRVPSAIVGILTVLAFFALLKIWHGLRSAVLGTILFTTSAWTLHVSRLATLNVEYLAAMTFFLLSTAVLQKGYQRKYIYWIINFLWGLLLYVPGMVFILAYNAYRQRKDIAEGYKMQDTKGSKIAYIVASLIWLPLLIKYLVSGSKHILYWFGFPSVYSSIGLIFKDFFSVFYHIFIFGPLLPDSWLGRAPILDIFSIIAALAGIYFYATHYKASRTHLLFISLAIGAVLIALGGPVGLSIVMPIIYVLIASGIAYILSQWLSVFPENPIARSLGYILISLAITASVVYNLRAYFVAWPNNSTSVSVFDVRPKD
jgi:hypothetical protein